jgi:hypothetical protein
MGRAAGTAGQFRAEPVACLRGEHDALGRAGGVGPGLLDVGERCGAGVDAERSRVISRASAGSSATMSRVGTEPCPLRGLLERAPSTSDGRAVEVLLTPAGAELAGRLYTRVEQSLHPMTSKLTPAEQGRLQALLERTISPH